MAVRSVFVGDPDAAPQEVKAAVSDTLPVVSPIAASCRAYGCVGYLPEHDCQCNEACAHFGNCCSDYQESCGRRAEEEETATEPKAAESAVCAGRHENCWVTRCCQDDSLTCYMKNPLWAGCRAACVPGIDPSDPEEVRTEWTCTKVSSTPPVEGTSVSGLHADAASSTRPLLSSTSTTKAESRTTSTSPQSQSTEEVKLHRSQEEAMEKQEDSNSEWEVVWDSQVNVRAGKKLGSEVLRTKSPGAIVIGHSEKGWLKLFDEPGYMKVDLGHYALLKKRVVSYKEISSGTCVLGKKFPILDRHACKFAGLALGRNATSRPQGCLVEHGRKGLVSEASELCSSQAYPPAVPPHHVRPSSTTTTAATKKVSGHLATATAKASKPNTTTTLTLTPTTSPPTSTTSSSSSTTHAQWRWPSLFCFEVMRATGYEPGLVTAQLARGVSVFDCDEFSLFSDGGEVTLHAAGRASVRTIAIPKLTGDMGKYGTAGQTTNSWLNTLTFMQVWEAVGKDGRFRQHDWTIKVDPDAVFFPDRLRKHLDKHTPPGGADIYLHNCARYPDIQMLGSLEVMSRQAVEAYLKNKERCRSELSWKGWGEDFFMQHCLDLINVDHIDDMEALGDVNCFFAPCTDRGRVAYHPFKTEEGYFNCWNQSSVVV